jgi:hypothetical protein
MPRKARNREKELANRRARRAESFVPDSEKRAPAQSQRQCDEDGCTVFLSIYNTGTKCHVHQRMRVLDGTVKVFIHDYLD